MAITAYTGVPGAGKTYALVQDVILQALANGRNVLTNVAGVKAAETLKAAMPLTKGKPLGTLRFFHGEDLQKPGFFPDPDDLDQAAGCTLQAGDLLVFDEVRLYWPSTGKFDPATMRFLRYHRHHVAKDGTATDIVVCSQMIADFHRDWKGLIESSLKFKKLGRLGLSGRYVYQSFDGSEQRATAVVANGRGKYRQEIYSLYSSYNGGANGQEKQTDKRANLFNSSRLWISIVLVVVAILGGGVFLWNFFHPASVPGAIGADGRPSVVATAPGAAKPGAPGAPGAAPIADVYRAPQVSSTWRIAGVVDLPGRRLVVLADRAGVVRYEDAAQFTFVDDRPQVGTVEGQRIVASSAAVSQSEGTSSIMGAANAL